ncbi:MAG: HD-GYP domain-containing protein [Symbiobacteriia bacterium]
MRIVNLAEIESGARLARTIYSPDGRVLLSAGVTLQGSYLNKLKELGVTGLFVSDGVADDIDLPEIVRQETRMAAVQVLHQSMAQIPQERLPNVSAVRRAVEDLVAEIMAATDLVIGMVDLKSLDGYTFAHSVNVAILAIMVGRSLDFSHGQLLELGTGALLHDIGKCLVPQEYLQKAGELNAEEFLAVKKHTDLGFHVLRTQFQVGLMVAHVAFQHHERIDGTGYPRGLKGDDMIDFAKLVAAADVYDAVTSDRVYRSRSTPEEGMRVLHELAGIKLDERYVRRLTSLVVPYPPATTVRLSDGSIALVVAIDTADLRRPQVRIMRDPQGRKLSGPAVNIDLTKSNLNITGPACL